MIKLITGLALIALTLGAPPSFAMQSGTGGGGGTIPANCTMDPFSKERSYDCSTWVCHKDKNGREVCTITTVKLPY